MTMESHNGRKKIIFWIESKDAVPNLNVDKTILIQKSYLTHTSQWKIFIQTNWDPKTKEFIDSYLVTLGKNETVKFRCTIETAHSFHQQCSELPITKQRFWWKNPTDNRLWCIDEYLRHNKGLTLAYLLVEDYAERYDVPSFVDPQNNVSHLQQFTDFTIYSCPYIDFSMDYHSALYMSSQRCNLEPKELLLMNLDQDFSGNILCKEKGAIGN